MKELTRIIPNSEPRWRTNASIKKMVKDGIKKGYTDIGKSRHSSYKSVEIKLGGGGGEILGIKNEKG